MMELVPVLLLMGLALFTGIAISLSERKNLGRSGSKTIEEEVQEEMRLVWQILGEHRRRSAIHEVRLNNIESEKKDLTIN